MSTTTGNGVYLIDGSRGLIIDEQGENHFIHDQSMTSDRLPLPDLHLAWVVPFCMMGWLFFCLGQIAFCRRWFWPRSDFAVRFLLAVLGSKFF